MLRIQVAPAPMILFFSAPEEVLKTRLLKRAETSGRADDNEETIVNRIALYNVKTLPIVEMYSDRVVDVSLTQEDL